MNQSLALIIPLLLVNTFAATTLKIIQCKEEPTRPLRSFMYVGEILDFDVKLNGQSLGGMSDTFTWSVSNTALANIDSLGFVTAKATGKITVTVKYKSGSNTATAKTELQIRQKVTAVTISDTSLILPIGSREKLTATLAPSNATGSNLDVVFASSNASIVTVDKTGNITGKKAGIATITATFTNQEVLKHPNGETKTEYVKASCRVEVRNIPVMGVVLNYDQRGIYVGQGFQLKATLQPSDASVQTVTWSSANPLVARVDQDGKVVGEMSGSTIISCVTSEGGYMATCAVDVDSLDLGSIVLEDENITVYVGKTASVKVAYAPEPVTWHIGDSAVASLSVDGQGEECIISGLTKGDTTLTASTVYNGNPITAVCRVKVRNIPPKGLTLAEDKIRMDVGEEYTLDAHVIPPDATVQNITYVSSSPEVVTVDAYGRLKAQKANVDEDGAVIEECVITAVVEGKDEGDQEILFFSSCEVEVLNVNPNAVSIQPREISLKVGDDPVNLIGQIQPENTTIRELTWFSENEDIASVDVDGTVVPVAAGEVQIRAYSVFDPSVFGDCKVTVIAGYGEEISLKEKNLIVGKGHTGYIQVLSAPGRVTFTSLNPGVATVDANGYVTGVDRGETEITLESYDEEEGRTVQTVVMVRVIQLVERIVLNRSEFVLNTPGGRFPVEATVYPEDADVKTLAWSSDQEAIAAVDPQGVISPVGYGRALVTAKATDGSEVHAEIRIDVAIPPSGIRFLTGQQQATLYIEGAKRDTVTLEAQIVPMEASHREVVWSASGNGVLLRTSGQYNQVCEIVAMHPGNNIEIRASDVRGMRSALFTVDVREKVTGVQIHMASSDYGDEDVIQVVNTRVNRFALNAEVFPHNATDRRVLWESLDPRVQIDAEGNVLIPKDVTTGVCQVLVKTVDGDRRAVRKIKINQGVKSIVLTAIREDLTWQEQHTMDFRKDMELKVEVFPLTAHNKGVLAVSSDPDLVSAEYNMSQKRIILRPRKKPSVKPGNIFFGGAIISAVAEDGGGATGTFQLSIMEALEWPSL